MSRPFSEQLREAIVNCGTTRYSLAQQLDISESALSRFVAGKRGLTLDVIDKLADVLGLQLIHTVQKTRRPTARGRKPKGLPMSTTAKRPDWKRLARSAAADAGENFFSSRRGIWWISDAGALCLYDNNPFNDFVPGTGSAQRDRIFSKLRSYLNENGHKELASAAYPDDGGDAGYTFVMLVVGNEEDTGPIQDAWEAALADALG